MKELLDKRIRIKRKKPEFVMQCSHKLSRLGHKWRKPKGIDSKMRLNLKGYRKSVEPGYGSPKAVRGLTRSGLLPVVVSNAAELEKISRESHGVVISSKVGDRKRVDIIKKAAEKDITIINIKDAQKYIENLEEDRKKKKEEKTRKEKKKAEKKAKEKKEKEKKKDDLAEKVLTEEEKAAKEKKEKDRLLTKKEM